MGFLFSKCLTHEMDSPPPIPPVPAGKLRICVTALFISHRAGRAHLIANIIGKKYADKYETWYYFPRPREYFRYIREKYEPVEFPPHLKGHGTSPFIHFETGPDCKIEPIGGLDYFRQWVMKTFPSDTELQDLSRDDAPYVGPSANVCHAGCVCCCPIGDEPGTFMKNITDTKVQVSQPNYQTMK